MIAGTIIGTIIIVAVTIAIGIFADRKLGMRPEALAAGPPRPSFAHAAGEAPATAIRAGAAQLERLRASQRCRSCRELLTIGVEDRVRYDDRDLIVIQFRCPRCESKRTLYVAPSP